MSPIGTSDLNRGPLSQSTSRATSGGTTSGGNSRPRDTGQLTNGWHTPPGSGMGPPLHIMAADLGIQLCVMAAAEGPRIFRFLQVLPKAMEALVLERLSETRLPVHSPRFSTLRRPHRTLRGKGGHQSNHDASWRREVAPFISRY
jgi:hypothetical protein